MQDDRVSIHTTTFIQGSSRIAKRVSDLLQAISASSKIVSIIFFLEMITFRNKTFEGDLLNIHHGYLP